MTKLDSALPRKPYSDSSQ